MTEKITKLGISVLGLLQGAIGTYFAIIGLAFAFPDTEPGSMDYESDMGLVPLGWFLMIVWLAVMAYAVIRLRKSKEYLLSFLLCWLVGTGGFFAFLYFVL